MEDPADRRQLLTVAAVAARLNLTPKSVYALIRSGALPASNMGNGAVPRYRVKPQALDAFVAAREGR
jgi:excisionase family DNA binding protein